MRAVGEEERRSGRANGNWAAAAGDHASGSTPLSGIVGAAVAN
jgi:hypothetical protein